MPPARWAAKSTRRSGAAGVGSELLDLLGTRYAAYHFREHVEEGILTFDYRLHPGPSSTWNAIALLAALVVRADTRAGDC